MFTSIDPDRLAFAAFLAKQDVARLGGRQEQRGSLQPPRSADVSRPHPVAQKQITRPRAQEDRASSQVGCINEAPKNPQHSPPTRDPENCILTRRARPLHAPTERRLQSAKESHLRQLQSKIARYSSALTLLHLQSRETKLLDDSAEVESVWSHLDQCKVSSPTTNRRTRPKRENKNTSLVRPKMAALHRPRSTAVNKIRKKTGNPRAIRQTTSQMQSSPSHDDQMDPQELANFIWRQALRSMCTSNVVLLKPEQHNYRTPEIPVPKPAGLANQRNMLSQKRVDFTDSSAHPRSLTSNVPKTPDHHLVSQKCSPSRPPTTEQNAIHPSKLLHVAQQLDAAEAEEESIRRRWAHLIIGDDPSPASATLDTIPANPKESRVPPLPVETNPIVLESGDSNPENGILFTQIQPERTSKDILHTPPCSKSLELRLPTKFHRQLLQQARECKVQLDTLWVRETDDLRRRPVEICEHLVDELLDSLLNDVVAAIEQETSELVNELVCGELYSELPDSTLSVYSDLESVGTVRSTPLPREDDPQSVPQSPEVSLKDTPAQTSSVKAHELGLKSIGSVRSTSAPVEDHTQPAPQSLSALELNDAECPESLGMYDRISTQQDDTSYSSTFEEEDPETPAHSSGVSFKNGFVGPGSVKANGLNSKSLGSVCSIPRSKKGDSEIAPHNSGVSSKNGVSSVKANKSESKSIEIVRSISSPVKDDPETATHSSGDSFNDMSIGLSSGRANQSNLKSIGSIHSFSRSRKNDPGSALYSPALSLSDESARLTSMKTKEPTLKSLGSIRSTSLPSEGDPQQTSHSLSALGVNELKRPESLSAYDRISAHHEDTVYSSTFEEDSTEKSLGNSQTDSRSENEADQNSISSATLIANTVLFSAKALG